MKYRRSYPVLFTADQDFVLCPSQTARSGFMILAVKRPDVMTCPCVCTWSPMSMNSCRARPWKLPASVVTSTWWRTVAKTPFTCGSGSTHSTLSASTRCCRVLELIGKICLLHCFQWKVTVRSQCKYMLCLSFLNLWCVCVFFFFCGFIM